MCHLYMTDFAYDGPIFLVPFSPSNQVHLYCVSFDEEVSRRHLFGQQSAQEVAHTYHYSLLSLTFLKLYTTLLVPPYLYAHGSTVTKSAYHAEKQQQPSSAVYWGIFHPGWYTVILGYPLIRVNLLAFTTQGPDLNACQAVRACTIHAWRSCDKCYLNL